MSMKVVVYRGLCLVMLLVLMVSLSPALLSLARRAAPRSPAVTLALDIRRLGEQPCRSGEGPTARPQADPDVDWVTFDAISGTTYLVEAQVPEGSPADVVMELYDQCGGLPGDGQGYDFATGVRMEFTASASGPIYLKLFNDIPSVAGSDVAYHLSVRALQEEPTPGALVLVAGSRKMTRCRITFTTSPTRCGVSS